MMAVNFVLKVAILTSLFATCEGKKDKALQEYDGLAFINAVIKSFNLTSTTAPPVAPTTIQPEVITHDQSNEVGGIHTGLLFALCFGCPFVAIIIGCICFDNWKSKKLRRQNSVDSRGLYRSYSPSLFDWRSSTRSNRSTQVPVPKTDTDIASNMMNGQAGRRLETIPESPEMRMSDQTTDRNTHTQLSSVTMDDDLSSDDGSSLDDLIFRSEFALSESSSSECSVYFEGDGDDDQPPVSSSIWERRSSISPYRITWCTPRDARFGPMEDTRFVNDQHDPPNNTPAHSNLTMTGCSSTSPYHPNHNTPRTASESEAPIFESLDEFPDGVNNNGFKKVSLSLEDFNRVSQESITQSETPYPSSETSSCFSNTDRQSDTLQTTEQCPSSLPSMQTSPLITDQSQQTKPKMMDTATQVSIAEIPDNGNIYDNSSHTIIHSLLHISTTTSNVPNTTDTSMVPQVGSCNTSSHHNPSENPHQVFPDGSLATSAHEKFPEMDDNNNDPLTTSLMGNSQTENLNNPNRSSLLGASQPDDGNRVGTRISSSSPQHTDLSWDGYPFYSGHRNSCEAPDLAKLEKLRKSIIESVGRELQENQETPKVATSAEKTPNTTNPVVKTIQVHEMVITPKSPLIKSPLTQYPLLGRNALRGTRSIRRIVDTSVHISPMKALDLGVCTPIVTNVVAETTPLSNRKDRLVNEKHPAAIQSSPQYWV